MCVTTISCSSPVRLRFTLALMAQFLRSPLPGAFDLLVYTDKDLEVPDKWEESGPQMIDQSETVRLRSFTTSIHEVKSMVAYKVNS